MTQTSLQLLKICLLACLFGVAANAEPRISEFLASNVTDLKDEDGDEPDWIEIHNPGTQAVDLTDWALSDDFDLDQPWVFPSITLAPGERLIVFASGKDRRDPAANLHTDFSLSAAGEYLALLRPNRTIAGEFSPNYPQQLADISYGTSTASERLVDSSTALSYHVPSSDIGTSWRGTGFSDPGGLFIDQVNGQPLFPGVGYDNNGGYAPILGTNVPSGTTTVFIRIPFEVNNPADFNQLLLEMQYDDAFVAWINGIEVARSSGAPTSPTWNSSSSANHEASLNDFDSYDLSSQLGLLQTGTNVLAIQSLNRSPSSSDLVVNPRLTGIGDALQTDYLSPPTPGTVNGASFVPGPDITEVTHLPLQPTDSDAIEVTAAITPRLASIASVTLTYRVMYGAESILPMTFIGNGQYRATIPASASGPGEMVRWKVTATDTQGADSRLPLFLDNEGTNQSPEYFGTVIADPSVPGNLPVYAWFTQNESGARDQSRTGARASFFYDGRFYDNIYVRRRGGSTNGSSQKFDFNKGYSFEYDPALPKVGEINLNANGADPNYLRQPIAFGTISEAGGPSSLAFPVHLRLNNSYDRVAIHIEQVDEDYVKRQDLPRDGALYKFVQRSNLRPGLNDTDTGTEKKTRLTEDFSDLNQFIDGLKQSLAGTNIENSGSLIHTPAETAARELFLFDNLNVPAIINYLAAQILTQDTDDTRKNFYLYRDSEGSGEWYLFPWDKDFTFGVGESAGSLAKHPFWADSFHKNPNANQWNILYDAVHNNPRLRAMILRRTRTLMDQLYTQSAANPAAYFESEAARLEALIDPVLNINRSNLVAEFDERRQDLYFNLYGPTGSEPLIPESQTPSLPLQFGALEFNPPSRDQDEEYIELINPNGEDLDVSGWQIDGGVRFTFAPGTIIPAGESIYLSPELAAFRNRATAPTGGQGLLVVGPYSGKLSNFGETLTLTDASGTIVDTTSYVGDPSDEQRFLVVSEIHYHPAGLGDEEFIELLNISDTLTLDLSGVKFTDGIDFDFAGSAITSLGPGERVLVVRDIATFEAIHGTTWSSRIAGEFANETALSNGGERIKVDDLTNSTIREIDYLDDPPWPTSPDGNGPSLVLLDPESIPDHNNVVNWGVSSINGTPGRGEGPTFGTWLAGRSTSDPLGDPDGDGWTELEAFVLAKDLAPRAEPFSLRRDGGETYVEFSRRDDPAALHAFDLSDDLEGWQAAIPGSDYTVELDQAAGDGTRSMRLRLLPPHTGKDRIFLRLRASAATP